MPFYPSYFRCLGALGRLCSWRDRARARIHRTTLVLIASSVLLGSAEPAQGTSTSKPPEESRRYTAALIKTNIDGSIEPWWAIKIADREGKVVYAEKCRLHRHLVDLCRMGLRRSPVDLQ